MIRNLLASAPDAIHPVTREITTAGARLTAAETFSALYRLLATAQDRRARLCEHGCGGAADGAHGPFDRTDARQPMALNGELKALNARLIEATKKPSMLRIEAGKGSAIELEIWS